MTRKRTGLILLAGFAALGTACGNPAVDPGQTFAIRGSVLDATGQPVQGAEVKVYKYWSGSRLWEPTLETWFSDDPASRVLLESRGLEEVKLGSTDVDGSFDVEVTGEEIAQPGGYTTGEGLVEVASVVVLVTDPNDASGRTGVVTYGKEFMRSDTGGWQIGEMEIWDSQAEADVSRATTTGLVDFRWGKIERGSSSVRNTYRLNISAGGEADPALIILCSQGDQVEGGCAQDGMDPTKLIRSVSAFSIGNFYSDMQGGFQAFVMARGVNFRYASRFAVQDLPDLTETRDNVAIEGIWAVGVGADQELTGTAAVDGDPATRETITNSATSIYAKLPLSVVTDAGVLNTLVSNAADACLVLEFSATVYADLDAAKGSSDSDWVRAGKFCGETGGQDEISALAGFDTTSSEGKTAGWMRLRAESDGMTVMPQFEAVGEVAIFKARDEM